MQSSHRFLDAKRDSTQNPPVAQAPTLYDFDIALAHVDRGLDEQVQVRTARHPSETLERVFLRVLAWCWFREERLVFGAGLSDPDAPDLEARDLTGELSLWIRTGKAEPARVQKVADQNARARVALFFESPRRLEAFVAAAQSEGLSRLGRVELLAVDPVLPAALAEDHARRCRLSITIVGDHFYVERNGRNSDGAVVRGSAGDHPSLRR
jgi:uncharacterized protein YaeQ